MLLVEMRKFFAFALAVLLFSLSAEALVITAPQEIPPSVNWNFSVDFGALDFSEAKLLLDGTQIAGLYVYSGTLFVAPNSVSQELASNVSVSGTKAFVSMNGMQKSEHEIIVDVYNNSEKRESISSKIIVSSSNETILERLDSMQATINSLATEFNQFKPKLDETNNSISAMQAGRAESDQKILETKTALEELTQRFENADSEIGILISDIENLRTGRTAKAQQYATEPAGQNNGQQDSNAGISPIRGFFAFAPAIGFWVFIALIIVFAVLAAIKFVGKKGFSFGEKGYSPNYDRLMDNGIKQSLDDQKQGKWSFEKTPEKKSSGLNFGSLLKRGP